jgi:hypothetical protein
VQEPQIHICSANCQSLRAGVALPAIFQPDKHMSEPVNVQKMLRRRMDAIGANWLSFLRLIAGLN